MERIWRREARWWPAACTLAVISAVLALTLELPRAFSDPNGLDPHVLRLAGVSGLVAVISLLDARLVRARPVLLAVAAAGVSFSVFSVLPRGLHGLFGDALSGNAQLFTASAAQAAVTLAIALGLSRWVVPRELGPDLRLHRLGLAAAATAVGGVLLLIPIGLAIPAPVLGREGVAVQDVAMNIAWLAPACLLQALAQEVQFRGMLQGALERVAAPWPSNLAQASLFSVAHLAIQYPGPAGPFIPVTFAFGLLFGWLTQRTNSLWPAVLIHGAADIAITVAVLPGLYGT